MTAGPRNRPRIQLAQPERLKAMRHHALRSIRRRADARLGAGWRSLVRCRDQRSSSVVPAGGNVVAWGIANPGTGCVWLTVDPRSLRARRSRGPCATPEKEAYEFLAKINGEGGKRPLSPLEVGVEANELSHHHDEWHLPPFIPYGNLWSSCYFAMTGFHAVRKSTVPKFNRFESCSPRLL